MGRRLISAPAFISRIARFGSAGLCVAAPLAFELVVVLAGGTPVPFPPFLLAVGVAAWLGGRWPGLLAVALAAVSGFGLLHSFAELPASGGAMARTVLFVVLAVPTAMVVAALRQAMGSLARAEARTRHVASFPELNPSPVVEADAEGRVTYANPAALQMWPELHAAAKTHPFLDDWDAVVRAVCGGRETWKREVRVGERVFEQVLVCPPRGEAVVRAYGFDITERLRAEAAVRRSEKLYRVIAHNLPAGCVGLHDRDLRIILADGPLLSTFGLDPSQLEGQTLREVLGEAAAGTEAHIREAFTGISSTYEFEHEGHQIWSQCLPIGDERGAVTAVLRVAFDVTDRKHAEASLKESEERAQAQAAQLAAILQCVGDGVIVYDREGRTTLSTASAEALLGIPAERRVAPVAERVDEQYTFLTEDGRTPSIDELPAVRATRWRETCRGVTLRIENAARAPRWLRMSAVPYELHGEFMGAVLSMTDVTERKAAEESLRNAFEKLREADHRRSEFLSVLSHELRNPLAPIRTSLYLLARTRPDSEQGLRALNVINRQVLQLTRLVDDLLDATRITRGKVQIHRQRLELAELLAHAADDHRALFSRNGVEFESTVAVSPLYVEGDPTRLAQVVGNLLQNAAKFTPSGGHVRLWGGAEGGQALIRVDDDGVGIAPELSGHLFEPFVQAEQTLDRSKGGLGLGLALVKGLVELQGGRVEARSAGVGKGASFIIRLPLDRRTRPRLEVVRDEIAPHQRRRVLIVEDNADAAETLEILLETSGHLVETAATGPEALRKAREFKPDLVLCDIGLPGMDGYEVARAFRTDPELRGVRLVALSGYAGSEDTERAYSAGFDEHVAKPFDFRTLDRVLATAAAGPEASSG